MTIHSNPYIESTTVLSENYGESKEGYCYWISSKFMTQIEMAVKIAEVKYPKEDGWRHVWIFDHSSCHSAMAEDSHDDNKMNVGPGGKQRVMQDGFWNGNSHPII